MNQARISNRTFLLLLLTGILVNASGLWSAIPEPDAALYAGIAKRMAQSGDWWNLYANGGDWLDKPHFPFWISALSFRLFGIHSFAYKLPSFIFWLVGLRYLYLLTLDLWDREIARISVLIYMSALHIILSNFDTRAEIYLTSLVLPALYYLNLMQLKVKWTTILAASVCISCAMMTKGVFVLITVCSGFILYWIISRQWNQFFRLRWWIVIFTSLILLLPELYALYTQFDLHPEKMVYGRTGVSGIRFFFIDSQFGRFFNTGPIRGQGNPAFYFHTILWAFLPWSILFYIALVQMFAAKEENRDSRHWIIYGSALPTFLLFTFSGFQLPHYIILLLPHASIITASYLVKKAGNELTMRRLNRVQTVLSGLFVLTMASLVFTCGFGDQWTLYLLIAAAAAGVIFFSSGSGLESLIRKSILSIGIFFLFMNLYFYPHLLHYQAGMQAASWIKSSGRSGERVASLFADSYSLEFYSPTPVQRIKSEDSIASFASEGPALIYLNQKDLNNLDTANYRITILQSFDYYHITMLSIPFLRSSTRQNTLNKMLLTELQKRKKDN